MSFVQQHGAKQMQSCLQSGQIPTADHIHDKVPNKKVDNSAVDPQLSRAVNSLAEGTPQGDRTASDQIADYEQRSVVQDRIYSDPANKAVFLADQVTAKTTLGRLEGAQSPEIPLSPDCTNQGRIPFDGWITDPNDRVTYYKKLSSAFAGKGSAWQESTMQQIIQQGNH